MSSETGDRTPSLRVDKWLWHARLCKTRTLAAKIVSGGKLRVNGNRATKPSTQARPGDVLTVAIHGRVRVVRILEVGKRRGPSSEAATLYEDLSPPAPPRDAPAGSAQIRAGARPSKRERRARDKLHSFEA